MYCIVLYSNYTGSIGKIWPNTALITITTIITTITMIIITITTTMMMVMMPDGDDDESEGDEILSLH